MERIQSIKSIFILSTILIGLLSYNVMSAQWTGPTAVPPDKNVSAPINVSAKYQLKNGDFGSLRMRANSYCDINGLNCFSPETKRTLTCPSGQAIRTIAVDGTVTCVAVSGGGSTIVQSCGGCPSGCILLSWGGRCTQNTDFAKCGCN